MNPRRFAIGFAVTAGVILLVSVTSRMTLRGSLTDAPAVSTSSSADERPATPRPIADPLSLEALLRTEYVVSDPSVRAALSAAGRTFAVSFDEQGMYQPPAGNPLRRESLQGAELLLDRVAVGDVDGDFRPDSIVPMVVIAGDRAFSEVVIVKNLGDDAGQHAGAYPLGPGTDVRSLQLGSDARSIRVEFTYEVPGTDDVVDASVTVDIAQAPVRE